MVASHDRTGFLLTRRRTLALGALAGGLAVLPRPAKSVVRLDITEGNFQPLPIAIPEFFAAGQDAPLRRTGLVDEDDAAVEIAAFPGEPFVDCIRDDVSDAPRIVGRGQIFAVELLSAEHVPQPEFRL